ncbi:hypothetical protein SY27_03680 [Flavobacterium sp. 316]|uniref:hypothetical protein n=1 Tax=Flavobacterium sp. 316 TaxID=1603293 RepID=UPI0005E313A1|nr:hypothetical protein [Flavobacterium sp. 316]KIX21802.1 hypothetical protein SY27_03680 [Flavobacterium sp. 316]
MNKIFNKIISPLTLLLTKGEKINEMKSTVEINICKGSAKVESTEMAVIKHYKPIIKMEL